MAALFVEAGTGRAPLGQSEDLDLLQNWGESLICTQNGSEKLAGPPPSVLSPAFLLQLPSSQSSVLGASALLLRPPLPSCRSRPLALPVLFLPLVLCYLGGSCLPTSLGCFPGDDLFTEAELVHRYGQLVSFSLTPSTRPQATFWITPFFLVLYLENFL